MFGSNLQKLCLPIAVLQVLGTAGTRANWTFISSKMLGSAVSCGHPDKFRKATGIAPPFPAIWRKENKATGVRWQSGFRGERNGYKANFEMWQQ